VKEEREMEWKTQNSLEEVVLRILARQTAETKNVWTEGEQIFLVLCHIANEIQLLRDAVVDNNHIFE